MTFCQTANVVVFFKFSRGLRAWAERDLLKKFGGKEPDGTRMLGFPIVTEPPESFNEINMERNTYDECVAQIIRDCDSALKYLPGIAGVFF